MGQAPFSDFIKLRGVRQNNLKGINLDIPKRTLTVITGLSGTGKSSLAFDTLFAEGQRRYMESLSTYAKQFLERLERPDYDVIEGISPTIAIEQKNQVKTARSTVGTTTEIYDYIRLLYARVGDTVCPGCGKTIVPDTVSRIAEEILALGDGTRLLVTFPVRKSGELTWNTLSESLMAQGFMRVIVDGEVLRIDSNDEISLDRTSVLLVVVDRLTVGSRMRSRLVGSLETAMSEGEGDGVVRILTGEDSYTDKLFTEKYRCPDCSVEFMQPTPLLFSFNNPYGACPGCKGFGNKLVYDEALIVPNSQLTLEEGAVDPWTKPMYEWWWDDLLEDCVKEGVPVDVPYRKLSDRNRKKILYGDRTIDGVIPFLEDRERKKYKKHVRFFLRRYQSFVDCPDCGRGRLRQEALSVKVGGRTIVEVSGKTIDEARRFFDDLDFSPYKQQISTLILKEIRSRLDFLHNVGVGYLTINRLTRTLSGGEAQRINLASALGNQLKGAIYVLDEPTIGLHPRDTDRLISIMTKLRDHGNTLLVVEHDREVIAAADHIVELGPEAGERGGEIVYEGDYEGLCHSGTHTGKALGGPPADSFAGEEGVTAPKKRRPVRKGYSITLKGARLHNLKDIDVEFPLGLMVVVTGVSGAGKSTLVHDILCGVLQELTAFGVERKKDYLDSIEGVDYISRVVLVDQSPIGKSPRSNPVSYVQALGAIREVFARMPLARKRRYKPGRFSFNVKGGRCEECKGEGSQKVEMHFMADVYVRCEKCAGTRFRKDTLEVAYKGKNIAGVLDMNVDEAIRFFEKEEEVGRRLWYLSAVGLGYLKLGQSATTLSGGEAQRVKIARELSRIPRQAKGKREKPRVKETRIPVLMEETARIPRGALYVLDEPTTGLHSRDVRKLLHVLRRLVDSGNTVLVIEHNLDIVHNADWIIDLGPEGGEEGGTVVATGTPEQVAKTPGSHTGHWLAKAGKTRENSTWTS